MNQTVNRMESVLQRRCRSLWKGLLLWLFIGGLQSVVAETITVQIDSVDAVPGSTVEVPVILRGESALAAMLLSIRYSLDNWSVLDGSTTTATAQWLALEDNSPQNLGTQESVREVYLLKDQASTIPLTPEGVEVYRLKLKLDQNYPIGVPLEIQIDAVNLYLGENSTPFTGVLNLISGGVSVKEFLPPIADAGEDIQAFTGDTVVLSGVSSYDLSGGALSYQWQFLARPDGSVALLDNTTRSEPRFTADIAGSYQLGLVVTSSSGYSSVEDEVLVTVSDPLLPLALITVDMSELIRIGGTVVLDGSGSIDGAGEALSYQWSLDTVPTGSQLTEFADATDQQTTLVPDVAGDYQVSLVVTNETGWQSTAATLNIPVLAASSVIVNLGGERSVVRGEAVEIPLSLREVETDMTITGLSFNLNYPQAALNFDSSAPLPIAQSLADQGWSTIVNDPPAVPDAEGRLIVPVTFYTDDPTAAITTDFEQLLQIPFTVAASVANGDYAVSLDNVRLYQELALIETEVVIQEGIVQVGSARPLAVATIGAAGGQIGSFSVGESIALDGSGSSDPGTESLTYLWSITQKPVGSQLSGLLNESLVSASFVADVVGTYRIALRVTNESGVESNAVEVVAEVVEQQALTLSLGGPYAADRGASVDLPLQLVGVQPGMAVTAMIFDLTYPAESIPYLGIDQIVLSQALEDKGWVAYEMTAPAAPGQSGDQSVTIQLLTTDPAGAIGIDSIGEVILPFSVAGDAADQEYAITLSSPQLYEGSNLMSVALQLKSAVVVVGAESPLADAGSDQQVDVAAVVTLDGSGSSDPAGLSLGYQWSLDSAPVGSQAALDNTAVVAPKFSPDLAGEYQLSLQVTNTLGLTSLLDSVVVTAAESISPPQADAGAGQQVNAGDVVTLDGSASTDPAGLELSYQWTLLERPLSSVASLQLDTTVAPELTPDRVGNYVVGLVVSNSAEVSSVESTVTIEVTALPPTADAGVDQMVEQGDLVQLSGTGSTDSFVGGYLNYQWSIVSAPENSMLSLGSANSIELSINPDQLGIYQLELVVTSSSGLESEPDSVIFVVTEKQLQNPVALAGFSQRVRLDEGLVTLDGSGSIDPNGESLTYAWSVISVPVASSLTELSGSSSVAPSFTPDVEGGYQFGLRVTNESGVVSAVSTVSITVEDTPLVLLELGATTLYTDQLAGAGLPLSLQDVHQSVSEIEFVLSYPSLQLEPGDASGFTFLEALPAGWQGTLELLGVDPVTLVGQVKVVLSTESIGFQGTISDFVTIPFKPLVSSTEGLVSVAVVDGSMVMGDGTSDYPFDFTATAGSVDIQLPALPVAIAGSNQVVEVGSEVTLSGESSYDARGELITYQWSVVEVPDGAVLAFQDETLPLQTFIANVTGKYRFSLLVTNENGLESAASEVEVSVLEDIVEPIPYLFRRLTVDVGVESEFSLQMGVERGKYLKLFSINLEADAGLEIGDAHFNSIGIEGWNLTTTVTTLASGSQGITIAGELSNQSDLGISTFGLLIPFTPSADNGEKLYVVSIVGEGGAGSLGVIEAVGGDVSEESPFSLEDLIDTGPGEITNGGAVPPIEVEYTLKGGWNLVGFPMDLGGEASITKLVTEIPDLKSIWHWSESGWKSYVVGTPLFLNSIQQIEPGKGYFIELESTATQRSVVLSGEPLTASLQLSDGWNMVSFNQRTEDLETLLLFWKGVSIWSYSNVGWKQYISGLGGSTLNVIEPGVGYLINVNSSQQ